MSHIKSLSKAFWGPFLLGISLFGLLLPAPALGRVLPLSTPAGGDLRVGALALVRANREALGGAKATLRVRGSATIPSGQVVYVQQVHRGLPVLGGDASVVALDGRFVALSGQLWPVPAALEVDGGLDRQAARAALRRALVPGVTVRGARQAVLPAPGEAGRPRLVWVLDALQTDPLATWDVVMDARSARLLWARPTSHSASAKVYTTNPKVGSLATMTLQGLTKTSELTGQYANVQSCGYVSGSIKCQRYAKPDSNGDYLYAMDEGKLDDPFAEVMAYYHVDRIHRWMKDTFKFARITNDQSIDMMVNVYSDNGGKKQGMSNAFFGDANGDGHGDLVFGQGSRDFAYDGDVIYHEFTHSAVRETSGLTISMDSTGFNAAPLALNEGFADLFSSILAGDPVVGDYVKSSGIRNISGQATCPDKLSGESHADGLLFSRAVWTVRSKLTAGSAALKTYDEALYSTMTGLNKSAGFVDAYKLLLQVLQAKDTTLAASMDTEFKSRGLDTCTRIIPLAEGKSLRAYIYGKSISPQLSGIPGPFQYKIEVPKTAKSMTLNITGGWGWGAGIIGAYIRKGKIVGYDYVGPLYDLVKPSNTTSMVLTVGDATKPLTPGETYYVLPLNVGNNTTMLTINYSIKNEDPPTPDFQVTLPDMQAPDLQPQSPDAGVAQLDLATTLAPNTPARGCSVASDASHGTSAGLTLVGLLLVLLARRRRC